MNASSVGPQKWFLVLNVAFLFLASLLRGVIHYWGSGQLYIMLALLTAWLAIYLLQPSLVSRFQRLFPAYLVIQGFLIVALMSIPGREVPDYFALLFTILSMQVIWRYSLPRSILILALFSLSMCPVLIVNYSPTQTLAFVLVYTAADAIWAAYALAARRSQEARARNQALTVALEEANQQLKTTSEKLEQLSIARERNRLARDLHDSVTQTLFSMNLTTQSAILLMDVEPARVGPQLDRLSQLTQGAQAEILQLISELRPQRREGTGLASEVRRYLAETHFPESFSVDLKVEGNESLNAVEEDGLFRIIQEALNNVVKHARVDRAAVRLHLCEPFWVEIEDHGQGFDLPRSRESGRFGLANMRERAEEMDWSLKVTASHGVGTRIRVEKGTATGEKNGR